MATQVSMSIDRGTAGTLGDLSLQSGMSKTRIVELAVAAFADLSATDRAALNVKYPKAPRRPAIATPVIDTHAHA